MFSGRVSRADVVNELLEQAQCMLDDSKVHPLAPAVLIGASLESFLRDWVETERLEVKGRGTPGMADYAQALKTSKLLTKQDVKDIRSWAGLRNDAAHGNSKAWEDPDYFSKRVEVMLAGVNLFLRKHGGARNCDTASTAPG